MAKAKSAGVPTGPAGNNDFSKAKAVADAYNKKVGKKLVYTGDEIPLVVKIPFREPSLDYVSDGGYALGRFTELLGKEHSGKTRAALRAMSQFQQYCFGCHTPNALTVEWKKKAQFPEVVSCTCSNCDNPTTRIGLFIDVEGSTDRLFMKRLGVDPDGVIYLRPDQPQDAANLIEGYLRADGIGLIILDSFGVMGGVKEANTAIDDINMNQNAVWFNMMFRKFQAAMNASFNLHHRDMVAVIYINQSYQSLSMYTADIPQGGRGARHGKGLSIIFKSGEKVKDKDEVITGVHTKVENMKNKTGMPYRKAEFFLNLDPEHPEIKYGETDVLSQYVDFALKFGIVSQNGTWYDYKGSRVQGKAGVADLIANDAAVMEAIDAELYKHEEE